MTENNLCTSCGEPGSVEPCEVCNRNICDNPCGRRCQFCDGWFCRSHIITIDGDEFQLVCNDCYPEVKDIISGDYSDRDGHDY